LSWQQNAFLTGRRNPTRRSLWPVGALINILGYDCLAHLAAVPTAARGFLNEHGKPYAAKSVASMLR
jgi:hypothetical protein